MSKKKPTYAELQARLEQAEAVLDALRRGEIDSLLGEAGPLLVQCKSVVDELARLRAEAEELAQQWQITFDATGDAIWILDAEQRVVRANKAAEAAFGCPLAETPGRRCFDIAHHTDAPIPGCPFCTMCVSGRRESFEMQLKKRWYLVTVDPLWDAEGQRIGAVHIARDITEHKRAEEQIRFQANLVANVSDAIIATDMAYNILSWNAAAEAIYGWKAEEVLEQPLGKFLRTQFVDDTREGAIRAVTEKGGWKGEVLQSRKDGTTVPILASVTLFRDREGNPQGLVAVNRDISERKEAERKIRESEETYRNLFQNAQVGLFRTRISDGKILESNEQLARMFGYDSREEFIAEYVTSQNYVDAGTRERLLRELREHGEVRNFQARFYRKDGSIFWAQYSARIYPDKGWIEGVAEDITAHKEAEEQLRAAHAELQRLLAEAEQGRRALLSVVEDQKRTKEALRFKMEQLGALTQAGQAVTASLDLEQVLAQIVALAGQVVGPAQASIVLVDEAGLMHESAEGVAGVPAIVYRMRSTGFTDWIIRSHEPVIVDDIATDGSVNPTAGTDAPRTANLAFVAAGIRSFAGLPLIARGRLLGVLFLHSTQPYAFHGQLELLTAFASQAAIAIENARLYDAAQKELAARQEAEEAYRVLVERSLQGIVVIQDGRMVFANSAFAALSGYSQEELLALSPEQLRAVVHPEDQEWVWDGLMKRLLAGEPVPPRREFRFLCKDGTVRWVESLASRIEYRGRPAVQAAYLDITERKQAEEALRAREAELAAVFESTPILLALVDEERRVTKINRAGADFVGRPADELLGLLPGEVLRCIHASDDPRGCGYGPHCEHCVVRRSVLDTLRAGRSHFQVEADYPVHCDSHIETLRLLVSTTPVATPAGPRVLVCLEDITVRHRTLEALRAIYNLGQRLVFLPRVEEIAQLVTNAAWGVLRLPKCELWLVDEQARNVVPISQTPAEPALTICSLPLDDERGIISAVVHSGQTIYLPDVDRDPRYIRAAEYSSRSELCVPLKVRERTMGALNSENEQLNAFSPADRQLLEALANAAAVAIENARLYEETRRERELNESIVRTALDGIVLQDADGFIILANPAAETMLGYGPGELNGQQWMQFIPPDQQSLAAAADARARRGQGGRYELDLMRRDGSRLTILLSNSPRFEQDRFAGTLMVFSDITDRKRAEQEIHRRTQELATLYHASQVLAQSLDPEVIGQRLIEVMEQLLGYKHCAVFLVDEATQEVLPLALSDQGRGPEFLAQDKKYAHSKGLRVGQGIVGWVIQHGRPVRVGDARQDPRYFAMREDIRSELCVPMIVGDKVIGAINVETVRPDAYDEDDERLLTALAGSAAMALQNARLYEETCRRAAQQEALNAVIAAATTATDLPSLLETALEHTLNGLGLEMGAIWVREQPSSPITRVVLGLPDPTGTTIAREITGVVRSADVPQGELLVANDWHQATGRYVALAPIMVGHNIAASITVRIGDPDRPLGELTVAAEQPRTWTAEEVTLVEAMGRQLTGAIVRLQLLQQTQRQTAQMKEVLDTVPAGVLLLDAEHRILVANPLAQEYLTALGGVGVGEMLERLGDRPVAEFLQPLTGTAHDLVIKGPPERVFTVLTEAVPMEGIAATAGWIMVLHDVTRDRAARQHLEMRDRLAAVGQLAAGIAHDFNNILSIIMLNGFMLRCEPKLSVNGRERVKTIHDQAELASHLIGQLLDFSRHASLEPKPLELVPFLKEFVQLLKRTLPEHIRIHLHYPEGEFRITADPTRLQQVLMNLAVNARDAMPAGGELTFELARLHVTGQDSPLPDMLPGTWISIQVSDTGCGIPSEVLPHIFEPFFTTKKPTQGTGLGLAQVYGIVKQHGGEIAVRSVVGQGTTLTLYFPLTPATATEFQAAPEPQSGAGQTILLVEDNPSLRLALAETLEFMKYRTLQVSSGGEALALLSSHPEIALVLSDLIMPDLGGKELLRAIRTRGLDVPVIIMSGHPLHEHLAELQPYDLAGWLTKPPDLQKLTKMISEVLENRSKREG